MQDQLFWKFIEMSHRATIMDVARLAGVSKVTVSYVLNGHSSSARISNPTKERVLKAAKELDYSPSAIARMMVTKRCQTIGVVFQYAQYFATWSDFTNEVMLGICQASVASGFDLMLHTRALADPRSEVDALTDGRVDGVLILRDKDDPTLSDLINRTFPCVLFFTRHESEAVSWVDSDNYGGGRIAAEHLIQLGHRKIGMICGSPNSTSAIDRLQGFRDALKDHNIPLPDGYLLNVPTIGEEPAEIEAYLARPDRPSAVFCFSDDGALHTIRTAQKMGLVVPGDLSVVGFDSLSRSEHSNPPLTSVRQPVRQMAQVATEILIKIANKEKVENTKVVFPTELDVRGSTAPPKG